MTTNNNLCPEAAKLQGIINYDMPHPNRSKVFEELTNFYNYATKLAELKAKSKDEIGIKDMQRRYDGALSQLHAAINMSQSQSFF